MKVEQIGVPGGENRILTASQMQLSYLPRSIPRKSLLTGRIIDSLFRQESLPYEYQKLGSLN